MFARSALIRPCMAPLAMVTRTMATNVPKAAPAAKDALSNRQKFKQIAPPSGLFDRLERLGFGTLRRTKRYQAVRGQQKHQQERNEKGKSKKNEAEPHYRLPPLTFYAGAKQASSFPKDTMEEIGFVGRSNVGKSSLLNSLAESTIVRTSDKPGLTQQINFYTVGRLFMMVDMPGYGFAFAEDETRQQWKELIDTYITERRALKRIFVVIDARHGVKLADLEFLKVLDQKNVRFQVVMTKCDLVVLPTLARRMMLVQDAVRQYRRAVQDVLVVSSKTGAGVNQMRKELLALAGHLKQKDFYIDLANKKNK
ncbi:P-loop containing nucleoside triphosphate hydrolase protein [Gongronella butleri]|nr:P-loop containing nucleoside triphosphate hydrolase protein [Gongronella butleri]